MAQKSGEQRAGGRPRDARTDRAIVAAILELIAERGVVDLRMDEVADRAGVGKAAIYRRYRSKDELVVAAVAELVSEITIPDTGSTRADLLALMRDAVRLYSGPVAAAMPAVVAAMQRDQELADALRRGFLGARRDALERVLRRGVARGDLASDADLELALDVLGGPLFYRLLVTGETLNGPFAEQIVELILRGFAPAEPTRTKEI